MLATHCEDVSKLHFPILASAKLDGVRAIVDTDEKRLLSRNLKTIPNRRVQEFFKGLPAGLDGELIAGDPCVDGACRRTVSMVMSDDVAIPDIRYYVFDIVLENKSEPFALRFKRLVELNITHPAVILVEQHLINNPEDLLELEAKWVSAGYEGVMLRSLDSPYKYGRSTANEGYLLKLKRFLDSEAEVIGMKELLHNNNIAVVNALGHTERSSHKNGKSGSGMLGALEARDLTTGVEFEIGTGFTAEEREELWKNPPIGKLAKYKYFPTGSLEKPRFPVFLGWRDRRDMS